MYRIQLFVNENPKRGKVLLDSWTCPTKEIAEEFLTNFWDIIEQAGDLI